MKKRLFCLLICLMMVVSMMPMGAVKAQSPAEPADLGSGGNYGIWIGDTAITPQNKNDVLGDGTVKFYPAGEYHGVNTADPSDTYGEKYPTLVLDHFTMKTDASHLEGTYAAQICIKTDVNIVLKGTNTLYKGGKAGGIYITDGSYVWFYGNGTLNVDTSAYDYDALVGEMPSLFFKENVKINLRGARALQYVSSNTGDMILDITDHARVNCYAQETKDGRIYSAVNVPFLDIYDDGWLICETEGMFDALYVWNGEYSNEDYDILILLWDEFQYDNFTPYTPSIGLNVPDGVELGQCRYVSIHAKEPVDCGGDRNRCVLAQFTDVPKYTNWAHEGIEYCVSRSLMTGTSATTFEPKQAMSRAMLVTVLYRMEGEPGAGAGTFSDVKPTAWFGPAVSWAADHGIVSGVGGGKFAPNDIVTREQIVTILYRYANFKGCDTDYRFDLSSEFADADKVGKWYVGAMQWAVVWDLINGTFKGGKLCLLPQGDATREQVAAMLMRFYKYLEG